jgi:hypothetical protein
LNGLLSTEAAGLRVEGRNAARSGSSDDSCPYPSGDWRRLEWRIGFIGFDRPVSPALVQQAYNARRRSARRRGRDMSAPVKPETTGKLCKVASCRSPIPWNARVSKAKNEAREFCCPSHQHAQQAVVAAERRAARAAVDPKGARRQERQAEHRRRVRESPPVEAPSVAASPAREREPAPDAVTPLMWRLAAASETEAGCRCAGLTPEQAARVMALQRRSTRAAA